MKLQFDYPVQGSVLKDGNERNVRLQPMTREMCHKFYKDFQNDPAIGHYYEYIYSPEIADRYFDNNSVSDRKLFAIVVDDRIIGECKLKNIDLAKRECSIGIHLQNDSVKGNGYGTQAEQLLLQYAFEEMGMVAVNADAALKNTRSQHVLEKVGFRYVREDETFRYYRCEQNFYRIIPYNEKYRDDMIFMVLEAKDALGRVPRLNEDLLDIQKFYLDSGDMFWLAINAHDRVVGCIGYNSIPGTTEVKLHRLYVKASLKRQGIGSRLLHTVEQHLQEQGKTAAHVHLGGKEYFESYSFYPKHGYMTSAPDMMKKEL